MAITRGRGSNSTAQTVATVTWTDILPSGYSGCEEMVVHCEAASAAPLLVSVGCKGNPNDSAHRIGVAAADTPDDWVSIAAGTSITFVGSIDNKITRAMVAGNGGTATLSWTVTKP